MWCYGFLQTLDSTLAAPAYHGSWELQRGIDSVTVARTMGELSSDPPGQRRILVGPYREGSNELQRILPMPLEHAARSSGPKVRERATCSGKVVGWTHSCSVWHMRRRSVKDAGDGTEERLASGGDAVREQRARLQKRGRKRRGRDMGHEVADACRFVPQ